jgi:hypothetical protein
MTLRLAAAAALALGVTTLLLYLHFLGKGPWADPRARHMRAMKDRTSAPDSFAVYSFEAFTNLPRRAPLATYAALESRGGTIEGYVQRIRHAPDNDVHLDLANESRGPDGPIQPYLVAEVPGPWRARSSTWKYERFVEVLRPTRGSVTPWDQGPRRARLSGWLMYDYAHEHRRPRPERPVAQSAWEIHPVTRIELWDDSLRRFVEYPR